MIALAGIVGLCVCLFVFALALGSSIAGGSPAKPTQTVVPTARFFAPQAQANAPMYREVPLHMFLSQLEHHIRLEEAAAQSFVDKPTVANLYAPTTSQWAN